MKIINYHYIFVIICITIFNLTNVNAFENYSTDKYEAIILGKITTKTVKQIGNYYITEYKLIPKKWLYKKPNIKEFKIISLKVLGAELPEKGLVIKASTTPNYIPIKKDAVFFLEKTKSKKENVFTVSKNGVLYKLSDINS